MIHLQMAYKFSVSLFTYVHHNSRDFDMLYMFLKLELCKLWVASQTQFFLKITNLQLIN
jgi:hypothetical protein